jgi:hypothetical protein
MKCHALPEWVSTRHAAWSGTEGSLRVTTTSLAAGKVRAMMPAATIWQSHRTGAPAAKAARPASAAPSEKASRSATSTMPQAWIKRIATACIAGGNRSSRASSCICWARHYAAVPRRDLRVARDAARQRPDSQPIRCRDRGWLAASNAMRERVELVMLFAIMKLGRQCSGRLEQCWRTLAGGTRLVRHGAAPEESGRSYEGTASTLIFRMMVVRREQDPAVTLVVIRLSLWQCRSARHRC